jgi:hypothetical protein
MEMDLLNNTLVAVIKELENDVEFHRNKYTALLEAIAICCSGGSGPTPFWIFETAEQRFKTKYKTARNEGQNFGEAQECRQTGGESEGLLA